MMATHVGGCFFFFFNDTATTEIYTLSLHDALPISKNRYSQEALAQETLVRYLYSRLSKNARIRALPIQIGRAHV